MRIDRLDLLAFGPFTEKSLDLSQQGGLHVIYGPNEAGKSSSLRAITDLLFGVPTRTNDSHLHKTTAMRIGAVLRDDEDQIFEYVRKKGNKDTILGADGKPHPQAELLPTILGDVNRDIFTQMFAIDHHRLREGGQSLEDGKGSLAESLFGAGLGNDVRETLKELKAEAEQIFKKTGTKPTFNIALKEFKEHKKEASERTVRPQQWKDEQKLLLDEEEKIEELTGKLNDLSRRLTQLRRIVAIAPHLSQLRRVRAEITALEPLTILPLEATEDRRATQKSLADAEEAVIQHTAHIENLKNEATSANVDVNVLDSADDIDAIISGIDQFETNQSNAPGMKARLAEEEKAIKSALSNMGKPASGPFDVDAIQQLLPPAVIQSQLMALTRKRAGLDETYRERQERRDAANVKLQESKNTQSEADSPEPSLELVAALGQFGELGPYTKELIALESSATQKRDSAAQALRALGLFEGNLAEAMSLATPSQQTTRVFSNRFEELDAAKRDGQKDIDNLNEKLRQFESEIVRLTSSGKIATEGELEEARLARNQGWALIKKAWLDGQVVEPEASELYPEQSLPDAFQAAMSRADEISDILRTRAKDAAELSLSRAELEQITKRITELKNQDSELKTKRVAAEDDWQALWAPLDITPRSPKEMESWLADLARLKERIETAAAEELKAKQLSKQIAETRQKLLDAFTKSQIEVNQDADLAVLAERARKLNEDYAEGQRQERARLDQLKANKAAFDEEQAGISRLKADLEAWQQSWDSVAKDYEILRGVNHEIMDTILVHCGQVAESIKEIRGTNRRLARVQEQMQHFADKVKTVAARCGLTVADKPALEIARELRHQLQVNRENRTNSDSLTKQIKERSEALADCQESVKRAKSRLAELIKNAGCQTIEELFSAEGKSTKFKEHKAEEEKIVIQITSHGDGSGLEALIEECESVEIDEAKAQLEQLEREHKEVETDRLNTREKIGERRKTIEQLDRGPSAAEALSRSRESLARCRMLAEDYTRLNLAIYLLESRMRTYEEESRGPIFGAASEIFQKITLGSFSGLDTEYDDNDKRRIVGKRSDGQSVGLEGFSDGSTDQLYLALRIASLEQRLQTGPLLPFIVDDIFVHFDDERTAATLKVLGELATKTQVLLFTHHQSVRDSAIEVMGNSGCVVNDLRDQKELS